MTPSLRSHYKSFFTTTGQSATLPKAWYSLYPVGLMAFPPVPSGSFPCSVNGPGSRPRHLYTDCLPNLRHASFYAFDLSLRVAAPPILSSNMVLYDASAMVRSHLARLLEPHLIPCFCLYGTLIEFPDSTGTFSTTLSTGP